MQFSRISTALVLLVLTTFVSAWQTVTVTTVRQPSSVALNVPINLSLFSTVRSDPNPTSRQPMQHWRSLVLQRGAVGKYSTFLQDHTRCSSQLSLFRPTMASSAPYLACWASSSNPSVRSLVPTAPPSTSLALVLEACAPPNPSAAKTMTL